MNLRRAERLVDRPSEAAPSDLGAWALGALFWLAAAAALAAALTRGGNAPTPWTLLSITALLACGLALTIVAAGAARATPALGRLATPALLWLGLLGYGLAQATPGLVDPSWAPDAWSAAAAAGVAVGPPSLSVDPGATLQTTMRMAGYGALFALAAIAGGVAKRARAFVAAFAITVAALSIYGVAAWGAGVNPLLPPDHVNGGGGVKATFVNVNSFAFVAGLGLVANLAMLRRALLGPGDAPITPVDALRGLFAVGGLWAIAALACLLALLLTGSRAGTLTGFVGVAVYFLVAPRRANAGSEVEIDADAAQRWRWTAALGVGALLAVGASVAADRVLERLLVTEGLDSGRRLVYAAALAPIAERPWLGHGLGAFHEAFRPYAPATIGGSEWDKAHNLYLEIVVGVGAIGAAAWAAVWIAIATRIARGALLRRRDRHVVALGVAALAMGAAHSAVDFPLQMPGTAALYALLLGVAWAQSFPSAPGRSREPRRSARSRGFTPPEGGWTGRAHDVLDTARKS